MFSRFLEDVLKLLVEYPWTSNLAQSLSLLSISMVVVSTVTFIISTADELQVSLFICVVVVSTVRVFTETFLTAVGANKLQMRIMEYSFFVMSAYIANFIPGRPLRMSSSVLLPAEFSPCECFSI
jgi:hypothetical protein